ncbi:unnamed protein product [Echinostoma caproni]|uniref:Saposin B-type domain-containing protein n=1 Tax=Echinostoma caproni TaxID=27848 RepID=A0A3P8LBE4_9TREM|nr:unnamed protein product [Echinostoma caproni]
MVKTVQSFVADNATADAIITYLDSAICDNLNDHIRDYCKQTVKVHVPVILQLIEVHLDSKFSTPNQLVSPSNLKLCSGQTTYSWINRPSGRNTFMFTSYGPVPFVHSGTATPDCASCVAVVDQMKERIKDPEMQREIKEDIKREICNTLGFMREVCIRAIDSQFDNMVREIEKVDSQKVCAVFRMCGPKALPIRTQSLLQSNVQAPGLCPLCELVIEKLIDIVVDKSTEASITAALDQVSFIENNEALPTCRMRPVVYIA